MAEIFTVYAEEKNTANVLICKQVLKQIPMPSPNSGANLQMPSSHIYYNFSSCHSCSPGIPFSAAVPFSMSLVNTNMEHCPFSLLSPKTILTWGTAEGATVVHGTGGNLKSEENPCSYMSWLTLLLGVTGHSSSIPAFHRVGGPLSGSSLATKLPNPSSPLFSYCRV